MLSSKIRPRINHLFLSLYMPIIKVLIKLGVTPNQVTLFGLLFALFTAGMIVLQYYVIGGILVLVGGIFIDMIDGTLAKQTNQVTKYGAYLDAVIDRYAEALYLGAIGIATGYWLLVFLSIVGSNLTSYAKARCGMEVKIENTAWPEFFERAERVIVLGIGLMIGQIFWALIILAIGSNLTAVQRILRAKKILT